MLKMCVSQELALSSDWRVETHLVFILGHYTLMPKRIWHSGISSLESHLCLPFMSFRFSFLKLEVRAATWPSHLHRYSHIMDISVYISPFSYIALHLLNWCNTMLSVVSCDIVTFVVQIGFDFWFGYTVYEDLPTCSCLRCLNVNFPWDFFR